MKNTLYITIAVVAIGSLCFFNLPWWIIAPAGIAAGFLWPQPAGRGYAAGFAGGFALWYGAAWMADAANTGMLSAKVGQVFLGLTGAHLLGLTGFIGGTLAGLGVLAGSYGRKAFLA
jgi:hypothetical protein